MAKNQKMQAMVKYNNDNDAFELWIRRSDGDDGDWGFCSSAKCYALGDEPEANFIHYSFLIEVLKCAMLGYEIVDGRGH